MRTGLATALIATVWASVASAEPVHVHVTAGAAHAVGGSQEREFGAGGGGAATLELPVGRIVGVQASAGGLVLAPGEAPEDPRVATKSVGTAFLGTVGVRLHPLGQSRAAGPWIDAGGGLAQTGSEARFALETHLGWDFRVSERSRLDVGPFIGFTQIVQPDVSLRSDDARVLWAGVQISFGARSKPPVAPKIPLREEPAPAAEDHDGVATSDSYCSESDAEVDGVEGCQKPVVALVGDRIEIHDIIHFAFNAEAVERRSYVLVARIARFIKDHPGILEISIEGHADARGSDEYNQHLSEARAASIRDLLVRFGVPEPRLRVVGHGESQLKVPTFRAEKANRRVEFIVLKTAPETVSDVSLSGGRP